MLNTCMLKPLTNHLIIELGNIEVQQNTDDQIFAMY